VKNIRGDIIHSDTGIVMMMLSGDLHIYWYHRYCGAVVYSIDCIGIGTKRLSYTHLTRMSIDGIGAYSLNTIVV